VGFTARTNRSVSWGRPSAYLIMLYVTRAYGGMDLWIHSFLLWALVGGEWAALRPCYSNPKKQPPLSPFDRANPRCSLYNVKNENS
jgi:hypothetical protein